MSGGEQAPGELPADDEVMAHHLAAGLIYSQVAVACNVHLNTVYRRMKDPAFRGRVDAIRRAVAKQVLGRIVSRLDDAVESLHLIATSAEEPADRIKAANSLLDHYLRQVEKVDHEERIKRLEAIGGGTADTPGAA